MRDYRKDACLTLKQFEKIILHCIIYYNTKRVIKNFPFSEAMIGKINPYANEIWNYKRSICDENLISISPQNLLLCLLPRTKGVFKRNGLKVNNLRYKHNTYTEMYLKGGEVLVAYNPEDVSHVWLIENGSYIKFDLIDSRFSGQDLSSVEQHIKSSKKIIRDNMEDNLQAQVSLSKDIEIIISETNRSQPNLKNIRKTREKEQYLTHKNFMEDYDL